MTAPNLFSVEFRQVTPRGGLPLEPIGRHRTALALGQAAWRFWMGTATPNFCADAHRAVLWDEAGNRLVVEPRAAQGAH